WATPQWRTGALIQSREARVVARDEVQRRVTVDRAEQRLRRGELVAVGGDVVAECAEEVRRAHRPAQIVEEVAALDVDVLVVARRRVAVDREVEPGRRAA